MPMALPLAFADARRTNVTILNRSLGSSQRQPQVKRRVTRAGTKYAYRSYQQPSDQSELSSTADRLARRACNTNSSLQKCMCCEMQL